MHINPIHLRAKALALAWLAWPLLALALPAAAARGPEVPDYPADLVASGLYVIHGPVGYSSPENQGFMNNPAFLVTETGVVVVDPGSSVQTGEMVLRQIRKVTDKPLLAVLNTHVHGDHWLGNQAMIAVAPEVDIWMFGIHKNTIPECHLRDYEPLKKLVQELRDLGARLKKRQGENPPLTPFEIQENSIGYSLY